MGNTKSRDTVPYQSKHNELYEYHQNHNQNLMECLWNISYRAIVYIAPSRYNIQSCDFSMHSSNSAFYLPI